MTEHHSINRTAVVSALWAVSVGLLISAWMVVIVATEREVHIGILLGLTSVVFAAGAATMQCIQVGTKICSLIRVTSGLEPPQERYRQGLESIR